MSVMSMHKTMLYLEDDQYRFLKKKAAEMGRSLASLVREAIAEYLGRCRGSVDYFSFVGIAEGPGEGAVSENAEAVLREHLRGERRP